MGGFIGGKQKPQRNYELERQLEESRKAEQARADALASKEKETADKQAKGLYGSRSLFGKSGGRGYFDTV
jgi:hypothetical protein|tara:strand:- start:14945 stop:15154 length:210 start_codon:yes stop_codon:yes gene_type:complete